MKRFLVILSLITVIISDSANAHADFSLRTTYKNCTVMIHDHDYIQGGFWNVLYILRILVSKVNTDSSYVTISIEEKIRYIEKGITYYPHYIIGYENEHLFIRCDDGFDYKNILKLIDYGLINKELIRKHQKFIDTAITYNYLPTRNMEVNTHFLSENETSKILCTDNPKVDSIFLSTPIYDLEYLYEGQHGLRFYFKRGKYYAYIPKNQKVKEGPYTLNTKVFSENIKQVIDSLPSLAFVLNDSSDNYLLFINDSTFFEFKKKELKKTGPFVLPHPLYVSWHIHILTKGDTIRIQDEWPWGETIFNQTTGVSTIDSSTMYNDRKAYIAQQKQWMEIEKREKQILKQHRLNITIVISLMTILTTFLLFYKRI